MDDRTFHDLVDALERGEPMPEDLDANDVAALAMARQLFAERQALPAAMAERRWTAETTQATQASAARAARRDGEGRRRLFGVRWLPELALLSLIAVLGLVMVLGARRGGMPAQGSETPVGATAAPASWLTGRMLFVQHILDDSTLSALDVRTGKTEVLWSVPSGSEPESAWMHTSSPDGTLVAYRLHRAGDTDVSPQRLAVRRTVQGAEAAVLELPANAGEPAAIVRMIWTPGSNHLYYANVVVHELDGDAVLGAFELHRLAVTQDSLGTVVLGPDERLWRLDGERLQGAIGTIPDGLIDVAAVHEPSGRAVLLAGDLERKVHAIQVVDLATGEELARVPTGGENVQWAATQDGSRLAFVDCTQCDTAVPVRVRRLDVAMAGDPAAIVDVGVTTASPSLGLVWSPSNRWLAFADVGGVRVVHDPTEPGVTSVPDRWLSATNDEAGAKPTSDHEAQVLPVVFSSQGDIVVTNALGLYDPATDTSFELPWSTRDNAIADHIGGGRGTFLGWVPDAPAQVAIEPNSLPAAEGRVLFMRQNGHTGGEPAVGSLDLLTGRSAMLWSVPKSPEAEHAWELTLSPDGAYVAYATGFPGDFADLHPVRIAVRRTVPDAEPAYVEVLDAPPDPADPMELWGQMIWSPSSDRLYFLTARLRAPTTDSDPFHQVFELHRLSVNRDTGGRVSLGSDELLWRYEAKRIMGDSTNGGQMGKLAAVHEPSGRAVVLAASGDYGVHPIQVLELFTGKEVARVATGRSAESPWAAAPDGSRLAYPLCSECQTGGMVLQLDIAVAGAPEALSTLADVTADVVDSLTWSANGRWFAFRNRQSGEVGLVDTTRAGGDPGRVTFPPQLMGGIPLGFSPTGDQLLGTDWDIYDIADGTTSSVPRLFDDAIIERYNGVIGITSFLGWVPDEPVSEAARATQQIERALPATDPAEPGLEGLHGDDFLASTALTVAGERAFVGFGDLLAVLDLRNPRAPGLIDDALQPIPDPYQVITDIAVAGDLAYLALRPQGLAILDLSTPWSERLYPSVADSMEANPGQGQLPMSRLAIAGQHLYGVRERDVVIVDISEPAQPVEGQTLPSGAPVLDVAVSGDTLLVLDTTGLTSYALANPDRPRRLGRMPMPGGEPPSAGSVKAVPGTELVLVGLSGATPAAWLVDLSDAAQPRRVSDLHVGAGVEALVAGASRAFVATDAGGSSSSEITAYDIRNAAAPRQLGRPVYLDDDVAELAEAGGVLFVATRNHGLKALAVDDPEDMSWIALDPADEPSISSIRLTPVPLPTAIATGPMISNDSWSPDGRWLAYWQSVDEQPDGGLHLFNVETHQRCDQEAVTAYLYERGAPIDWLPGGEIHVVEWAEGRHYLGQPCAGPLPTMDVAGKPTPTPRSERAALSPDGAYRVTTELLGTDTSEYTEKWRTQLVRTADAQVMATVDWDSTAKMRPDLGGEWLPDGRFLLSEDRARGPLLLDERGTMTEVATTWFKLGRDHQRSELRAGLVRGTGDKDWHVLLTSQELEDTAWLFHPETSSTEQLALGSPMASQYIPAPRGWLADRDRSGQVSVRPLDPAGAAFTPLAAATDLSGPSPDYLAMRWSPDGTRAVLAGTLPSGAGEVRLISFPDGIVRSRWPLAPPFNSPSFVAWSPDNRQVAVSVMAADQKREALYVLDAGVREAGR